MNNFKSGKYKVELVTSYRKPEEGSPAGIYLVFNILEGVHTGKEIKDVFVIGESGHIVEDSVQRLLALIEASKLPFTTNTEQLHGMKFIVDLDCNHKLSMLKIIDYNHCEVN